MPQTIRLNGSNYVSDKTRSAFENALKESPRVAPPPGGKQAESGNGHASDGNGQHSATALPPAETPETLDGRVVPAEGYAILVESLEKSIARSYEDHAQTVRVHEQYLDHQSEYAALVGQLLQQQRDVFSQGLANPQMADLAGKLLDSLAQSMARFHELQAQTLSVHKQFLEQQAQYSQAQTDLIRLSAPSGRSSDAFHGTAETAHKSVPPQTAVLPGHGNGHGRNGNGHHGNSLEGNGSAHQPTDARKIEQQPHPIRQSPAPEPSPRPNASISASAGRTLASEAESPHQPAPVPTPSASPLTQRPTDLAQSLIAIVSEKTGYPADMLDLSMDMEADLGIDSIKRVEILGAVQERHPDLPKVEPQALAELRTLGQIVEHIQGLGQAQPKATASSVQAPSLAEVPPPPSGAMDSGALTQSLLAIVSDKTGYPADMLDLSMDMEADLGIDSIKRVEILGAVQERHPDLPKVEPQALAELRTLGQIVEYLQSERDSKKV